MPTASSHTHVNSCSQSGSNLFPHISDSAYHYANHGARSNSDTLAPVNTYPIPNTTADADTYSSTCAYAHRHACANTYLYALTNAHAG